MRGRGVDMESWAWGLALKPLIGIVLIVGLVLLARYGAWLVWHLLPDGKVRRYLFMASTDGSAPKPLLPGQKGGRPPAR